MTNNQILEKFNEGSGSGIDNWYCYDDIITVMNMLREELSNTEQPQGVDVWVSMSDFNSYAQISMKEPEKFDNGSRNVTYLTNSACAAISGEFAKAFNISQGECVKFKIVRQP